MNDYYTYAYLREDGTPYYIGKGRNKRINCIHRGGKVKVPPMNRRLFLKKDLTEEEAFRHEKYMIGVYGRKDLNTGILLNRTEGGEAGGCRVAHNRKTVTLWGKGYASLKQACADNDISYAQYMIMINENLHFKNGEELKDFIWRRRSERISRGQLGNQSYKYRKSKKD